MTIWRTSLPINFRLRRSGVVAPGDPAPPPGYSGYFDYRHVLDASAFRRRAAGPFDLGHVVDIRRNRSGPAVGLFGGEMARHAAVIGPGGSGKTHGVLVPWIVAGLRDGASVIAVDVKGDLFDHVDALRRQYGPLGCRVVRLDYTRPHLSASWNWVSDLRNTHGDPDPRSISGAVEAILGKEKPNDAHPFFYQQDSLILQSVLELVATSSRQSVTAATVLDLISDQLMMEGVVNKYAATSAAVRLLPYVTMNPSDYARATSGVRVALTELASPLVEAITKKVDYNLNLTFRKPTLVILVAPMQDGRISQIFSSLVLNRMIQAIYANLAAPTGHCVYMVLDEAARLVDRIRIEEVVSVARSAGLSLTLALQDVTQIKEEREQSAILSNCSTYVSLSGVSEASARYLASRLGEVPVPTHARQTTRDPGRWQATSGMTTTTQMVPVLGTREIMAPPFGNRSAIVHSRDLSARPFVVNLERG